MANPSSIATKCIFLSFYLLAIQNIYIKLPAWYADNCGSIFRTIPAGVALEEIASDQNTVAGWLVLLVWYTQSQPLRDMRE